ncbi:MAG: hypothetical protein EZS28_004523 [Streblomastix strix]|uniref:Uncharacterized protein n=1 Tax=Streblomastix strix TaxID=222440 RepID=A0A5J4WYH7_9EUKA|nr:MAG: hypothetical protein EZS28_004523 [Streblomastix strix]
MHYGRDNKPHHESCEGSDQQNHLKLDKLTQSFKSYLKSTKIIQILFDKGKTKLFPKDQQQGISNILQSTKNYMCIDAETVEDQNLEDEQIYAQLKLLSIVIGTQINNQIQSKYIDIRTQDFMNKFREQMWELANEFYSEKLSKKVESYLQQDIRAGRDTRNNVTADDIDYFNQMIPNNCCYCQAQFTNVNKPTLEWIDNNIAHSKDNCKLAYQQCNSTRSYKDVDVAKLMIQMNKYASVKNLSMTIENEEIY